MAGREKIATFREKEKVTLDIYDNCDKRYALIYWENRGMGSNLCRNLLRNFRRYALMQ